MLPEEKLIPVAKFPEKVRRFVDPRAPEPMKLMLARGMVPMKPLVQVCALYQLAMGEADAVASEARTTVLRMPSATLQQVLRQPLLPLVLDWMAIVFHASGDVLRPILQNNQTDTETLIRVAKKADEETCEVISRNQARLLEDPKLVEALYFNRNIRASTADRVMEYAARNGADLSSIQGHEEIVAAILGEDMANKTEAQIAAEDAAFKGLDLGDAPEEEEGNPGRPEVIARMMRDAERRAAEEAAAAEEPGRAKKKSAAGRIRDLNIAQKVRLAMMGTKSERAILIKDTNKVVCRAVIRSPAVSAQEAAYYAGNKSLPDEVIAYIANKKKWVRHYNIRLTLVLNPKCPPTRALAFLRTLRANDLKMMAKSKQVPNHIGKVAKEMMKSRAG